MAKRKSKKQTTVVAPSGPSAGGKATWKLLDRMSVVASGVLAQRATAVVWRGVAGKKPPTMSRHPEVSNREAILWAVIGGSVTELVKTGVRRGTASYWVRSTGDLPPGMKPLHAPELAQEAAEAKVEKKRTKKRR